MAKKNPIPKKKISDSHAHLWEQNPEHVRKLFATFGEIEHRREDGDDLFMVFLDPDGKLRQAYGEEIDKQREVLQAIVELQTYGSSAEIKEAVGILGLAVRVLDWIQQQPNASWDRDYPREAGNKVLGEVGRLGHRQMMAECREETLRQHGLKYDSERQMAIPLGGKGRPSLFINRMIGMQAIVLRSTYSKPEDLRKEIHRRLSRFFPIPESEAGERGKIARAIENAGREVPKRSVRNNQQKGRNPA